MKIAVFRPELVQPETYELLKQHGEIERFGGYDRLDRGPAIDAELVLWPTADRFLPGYWSMLPNIKVLASATTTSQHIAGPVLAAAPPLSMVITLKDVDRSVLASVTPTAEHTLGLIWAVTRHIPQALNRVDAGYWTRSRMPGRKMLSASSLLIVGDGRIARMLYERARPLFADVTMAKAELARDMIASSQFDIASLHVPPASEPFINQRLLDVSPGIGYLINTSQGNTVNEWDVVHALEFGKLLGYASDCLNGEYDQSFQLRNNPLYQKMQENANIVLTPHIGGSTLDAWQITQLAVCERALELLK